MHVWDVAGDPAVRAARAAIQRMDGETIAEQLRIVAIPAPPGGEAARGDYLERRFREIGLQAVERDDVGNVIGWLACEAGAPVAVSAHLDTVFAAGVPVTPKVEGSRLSAPGITDNARGLAALLTIATVMLRSELRTRAPLAFVGTVGEEGAGDLRGAKHLFARGGRFADAAAFISIDGSGLRRVVHRAIGSRRLRVVITGPGGHSWSDWGAPNPVHAGAAAIAALAALPLHREPRATLTVARIGGGTSINAIPERAWLEVDIRSESGAVIARLEGECRRTVERAIGEENDRRRRGTKRLAERVEVIGDRPPGETPADHQLVLDALRATRDVGAQPQLTASSTDANIPMSMGIPAVTIGAGGDSGGVHTLDEWYDNKAGAVGIERALLLICSQAGQAG